MIVIWAQGWRATRFASKRAASERRAAGTRVARERKKGRANKKIPLRSSLSEERSPPRKISLRQSLISRNGILSTLRHSQHPRRERERERDPSSRGGYDCRNTIVESRFPRREETKYAKYAIELADGCFLNQEFFVCFNSDYLTLPPEYTEF